MSLGPADTELPRGCRGRHVEIITLRTRLVRLFVMGRDLIKVRDMAMYARDIRYGRSRERFAHITAKSG